MESKSRKIVLVGTSAGGMDALSRLVAQLPKEFPAAILIVQHMPADNSGQMLVKTLQQKGLLECRHGKDGESIENGRIYVAPSDHHMMVEKGRILITKGARENRSRPSIDPLFRSAAIDYGTGAIGVVLTGYLDDGTIGLTAIKRCGGVCVVQDPKDAAYPDMPLNALNNVKANHVVPLGEMGPLLSRLVQGRPARRKSVPEDISIEARIAKRVLSDLGSVNALGDQVPFNCPGCGGVLWQVLKGKLIRFRCHTGHAYTGDVLLAEQTAKIEETLWTALRMFEERKNLLVTMSGPQGGAMTRSAMERAKESEVHIDRIRSMLRFSGKSAKGGTI